jgi:hypothetical protein
VVLSRILHDWDEPRCQQVRAAAGAAGARRAMPGSAHCSPPCALQVLGAALRLLRPGGALLVAEMLLQADRLGPSAALLQARRWVWARGQARGHEAGTLLPHALVPAMRA